MDPGDGPVPPWRGGAVAAWRGNDGRTHLLRAAVALGVLAAAGLGIVWSRSEIAGAQPLDRPASTMLEGRVLERIDQPAEGRFRLVLATREPGGQRAIKVRVVLRETKSESRGTTSSSWPAQRANPCRWSNGRAHAVAPTSAW